MHVTDLVLSATIEMANSRTCKHRLGTLRVGDKVTWKSGDTKYSGVIEDIGEWEGGYDAKRNKSYPLKIRSKDKLIKVPSAQIRSVGLQ